jgi:ABC-type branched-subunit amino acid transport system substrate-binding protein
MLVSPKTKDNICDTTITFRIPAADAVQLETMVAAAKTQGIATSKASFIRYVLNEYANNHADQTAADEENGGCSR